jgi:predicted  nucleic acid-binding Zn-ribbon protein
MLTIHEQERFAFCAGHPAYSEIAAACDEADQIEVLELQIEDLEEQVNELEQWRDGVMAEALNVTKATNEELLRVIGMLRTNMNEVIADLNGPQCKTAAGRKELARVMQTRLIHLR